MDKENECTLTFVKEFEELGIDFCLSKKSMQT